MKKLFCILMAITMLCSLMVVNASATTTYEGEGFKIVTDYSGYIEGDMESDGTYAYNFYCDSFSEDARIQIFVLVAASAEEAEQLFYGEFYNYGEETVIDNRTAIITKSSSDYFCHYYAYAGNYIFDIELEAIDDNSYEVLKSIIETDLIFDVVEYESNDDDYYEENSDGINDTTEQGFEIITGYEITDYDVSTSEWDYGTIWSYFYRFEGINADLEVHVESIDYMMETSGAESGAELYEATKAEIDEDTEFEYKEILIDGIPAFACVYEDDVCFYSIMLFSDNYLYSIEIEAEDSEARDTVYDLVIDGFKITDSKSWYDADNNDASNADKADAENKTDKEDSDKSDNIVIIVAIVVAGVVVIAVVAIVVLGKKKKQ